MCCIYNTIWRNNIGKVVCHYTSFESAIKILATGRLRFGQLNKMNDINESYRAIWFPHGTEDADKYVRAVYNYRQISLTLDKLDKRGFDIAPMWGHYARKGAGVCIVLDKNTVKKVAHSINGRCLNVHYSRRYDSTVIIDCNNPDDFVSKNYKEIFYKKSIEWRYEREWRIIKNCANITDDVYLNIDSAIEAVIICNGDHHDMSQCAFSSPMYETLRKLVGNKYPIYAYEHFCGESLLKCKEGDCIWTGHPISKENCTLDS